MISFHANQLSPALKIDLRYQYNAVTEIYSNVVVLHYNAVTWGGLKSLAVGLFVHKFIQAKGKENIKSLHCWPFGDRWFHSQWTRNAENILISLVPCQLWHLMLNDHYSSRVLNGSDSCWSLPSGFMLMEINTKPSAFYAKSPAETGFEMWLLSLIIST